MFTCAFWTLRPNPEDRDFEYTAVPFPKGPNNPDHKYTNLCGLSQGWGIPRGVTKPEDVWEVFMQVTGMWFDNDWELRNEGVYSYPYMQLLTKQDADRILDAIRFKQKVDYIGLIPGACQGYNFSGAFYEGRGTPAQVVEEVRQEVEDAIAEALGR